MATWPRTIIPNSTTRPVFRDPLTENTQRGGVLTRDPLQAGVRWREDYLLLKTGRVDDEALMAFIDRYGSSGAVFNINHQLAPGSALAPNGTGTAGIQIDGASQTGSTLNTKGWPVTTSNVARAGDWIAVAGLLHRIKVLEDANSDGGGLAALVIAPAIWAGISPADSAAITTTGVTFSVKIIDRSRQEDSVLPDYYGSVWAMFEEAL